ncbi:MAG: LuxR family transcriptional regulator [Acidobacteria bacterium]|nr:MAG: LuxR family transcriptional regulator [Acidobacteriota bacterium]
MLALSLAWAPLAAVSSDLPVACDIVLELLYNLVALVWVARLDAGVAPAVTAIPSGLSSPAAVAFPPAVPSSSTPGRARLLEEGGITKREREIVELICEGKTNQEIADRLFISLATVKDHNYAIFQKLVVRNRTELTRLLLDGARPQPK